MMRVVWPIVMVLCFLSMSAFAQECQVGRQECQVWPRPPGTDLRSLTSLQNLTGTEFDLQYTRLMYQLHTDMQALAEVELKTSMDVGLRQLSQNISHEQYDYRKKLDLWYTKATGRRLSEYCPDSSVDFVRLQQTQWRHFDAEFVDIMLTYLQRAKDAATLLLSRSSNDDLRYQAGLVVKSANMEIAALKKWQNNEPMFQNS